jgi:hypothetical protein
MASKPKYAKKSGTSDIMRASTNEKKNLATGGENNLNNTNGHHHPNAKIKPDEMFKRPSSAPSNIFFRKLNLNFFSGMNEMAGVNIGNNHVQKDGVYKGKPVPDFFGGKTGQSPKN